MNDMCGISAAHKFHLPVFSLLLYIRWIASGKNVFATFKQIYTSRLREWEKNETRKINQLKN